MDFITKIFGGKKWYQSLTSWGLILWYGVSEALEQACGIGTISWDTCQMMTGWTATIGQILTVLGIRKAATTPNTE